MTQKVLKLFTLGLCLTVAPLSFAHRVNVFAYLQGNQVMVEGNFAGGGPAMDANVTASYPDGSVIYKGQTSKEGKLNFPIPSHPQAETIKIVLNAGEGHRNEWTLNLKDSLPSPMVLSASSDGGIKGSLQPVANEQTVPLQQLEEVPITPSEQAVEKAEQSGTPAAEAKPTLPETTQNLENFPITPSEQKVEAIDQAAASSGAEPATTSAPADSTASQQIPLQQLEEIPITPSEQAVQQIDEHPLPASESKPEQPIPLQQLEEVPITPSEQAVEQMEKNPAPASETKPTLPETTQNLEEFPITPSEQAVEKIDANPQSKDAKPAPQVPVRELEEIPISPAEQAVQKLDKSSVPPEQEKRFTQKDIDTAVLNNQLKLEQEVVGPLRRQLAMSQETVISFKDVVGGIGWILGIAGLIAWYQSRRKKK